MHQNFAWLSASILLSLAIVSPARLDAAHAQARLRSNAAVAPVGSRVTLYAAVGTENDGSIPWYRFRIRAPGEGNFQIVRDFSPVTQFDWTTGLRDGVYEVELAARSAGSGEVSTEITQITVEPRVTGSDPVLSATTNELVFLYSAPPCPPGRRVTVNFTRVGGTPTTTPPVECIEGSTVNVYLAGLVPESDYVVQHRIMDETGAAEEGPALPLTTPALSFRPSRAQTATAGTAQTGILFQNRLFESSVATDLSGNVVWYYPTPTPYLIGPQEGGKFLALIEDQFGQDEGQVLRLIDVAGNTLWETNAANVNAQLDAMGRNRMTSFHHDGRLLPNGNVLVLAANERLLTDVQGPGEVDVIGDMIIELDRDFNVVWVWDGFDHLNVTRKALLDEKCTVGKGGCPTFYLAKSANDWLHGNSISVTPDGGILYSTRHQDWIVKIDYGHGKGSGRVLWRLGKDGDFAMVSNDREPWFSHQHDASVSLVQGGTGILLFDNGNTRYESDKSIHSRGQLIYIDETSWTARLVLNADLGAYALALGSAATLPNGNYLFGLGWTPEGGSHSSEYDVHGNLQWRMEFGTQTYRSVRASSLYER